FLHDTAPPELYTLSLHDALPISPASASVKAGLGTLRSGAVDNLNNTLNQLPTSASHQQRVLTMQTLSKYQSYLSKLHANKSITDSLANLANKAQTEQKSYEQSVIAAAEYSNFIEAYDLVTILLIIGVGLGGISEIAKNKPLGYASLVVGGFGVIVLLLISFTPIVTYL